jgi:hypothetical protein
MEDSSIKKVTITSSAAGSLNPASYEEGVGGGSKRRTRKQHRKVLVERDEMDGGGTSPGTLVQLSASSVPGVPSAPVSGMPSDLTKLGAAIGEISPAGGARPEPKVIISKTKKRSKVLFTAPKPVEPPPAKKKTMKKVKMSMKNLTRRLKKANKIRKTATAKSIDDIKKDLIKMELVKPATKAPEDVLRQIYSDVEVMKKRAL